MRSTIYRQHWQSACGQAIRGQFNKSRNVPGALFQSVVVIQVLLVRRAYVAVRTPPLPHRLFLELVRKQEVLWLVETASPGALVERRLLHILISPYTHGMAGADSYDPEQGSVPGFDPTAEKYEQLDLVRWLTERDVLKKARNQGVANQPPSEASSLDANELQIVDWINHCGRKCREDVVRHLSNLERDLAYIENEQELAVLEQGVHEIEKNAEIALERKAIEGRNRIAGLEKEVSHCRRDIKAFREQSGLTRLPDYSHRSTVWKLIVGCVIAEIVANASLLMDIIPAGLLGAIVQMALISGVNVVICGFPMGELLRQRNHVQRSRIAASWAGIILITLVALIFNLAVGHFRDSIQLVLTDRSADVFQIGADALSRLIDEPFGLDSFHSVLLVLLGMSCFGFSSWKWLQRDDAYPDYGRRDRQLKQIEKAYVRNYDLVQAELDKVYRGFESKLEDIRHTLRTKQSRRKEICGRGTRLVREYPVNLGQYQHHLDYLLKAYRTANETVRTSPVPAHFERLETVDSAILEPPSFKPSVEIGVLGVTDRVHATISQVQVWFRDACRGIRPLDEI